MTKHYRLAGAVLFGLALNACEPPPPSTPAITSGTGENLSDRQLRGSMEAAWQHLTASGQQSLAAARQFAVACEQLRDAATAANLEAARAAWHAAHQQLQLLAPLFSLGDTNPGLFQRLANAHFVLDAWPIQPGYLDAFDIYLDSGVVNDIAIEINADKIRRQHGLTADSDVVLGMHAAAYLLWGEKGKRTHNEFADVPLTEIQSRNGLTPADLPTRRRSNLLALQASLMADDLSQLLQRLQQNASALSSTYASLAPGLQQELWRSSLLRLLRQLQKQVPGSGEDEEWDLHNSYAGHSHAAMAAQLRSIEALLYSRAGSEPALADWLLRQGADAYRAKLQRAQQRLREFEGDWRAPAPGYATGLQQMLEELAQDLDRTSDLPNPGE